MSYRWTYELHPRMRVPISTRREGHMRAPTWIRPVSTVIFLFGVGGLTWSGSTATDIGSLLTIGTGAITAMAGILAAIIRSPK